LKTIGFDIDDDKIGDLNNNNNEDNIEFTSDPSKIKHADFVIIAVPTPVTKSKEPDLRYVKSAVETVGKNLKSGATVVLESTVYPGVTEEIIAPILDLENES
jgi:UDPglucose 6-dehydrogenase/UDP-N-acetyl-D-galactosamine dehydrogenase